VRHDEGSDERPPRAHGEAGALPCTPHDFHGVTVSVLDHRVPIGDRDAPHVQLGRVEAEIERQHVVDAGIRIDNDRKREAGGGKRGFVHGL
jgi:hypothetical protein